MEKDRSKKIQALDGWWNTLEVVLVCLKVVSCICLMVFIVLLFCVYYLYT